ncbi:MAG TPA: hypothetical protein VF615_29750 [Longimicrobiaceae bacterium]
MKARVLLAAVVLVLASGCSSGAAPTAAERPSLDGVGTVGSGHRSDADSTADRTHSEVTVGLVHAGDPDPDDTEAADGTGTIGSGH